jgi:putative ABC transport system permease protein
MLFRRHRFDRDLKEELLGHVAEREAAYLAEGLTPEAARRRAALDFGNPAVIHEQSRDVWLVRWLEHLRRDIRIALRAIRSAPGFSAAVIATLALGIGANTAMFTIVDAALLRPLPYAQADRLVMVGDRGDNGSPGQLGYTTIQDVRAGVRAFDRVAAMRSWSPTMVVDGIAERVPAMRVGSEFFAMLGARPALGRDFTSDDDRPDQWRVVILSDGLWRRRFSADPAVVGRTLRMNDFDYRVIGVMPAEFEPLLSSRYYKKAEMWAALGYDVSQLQACRSCQHIKVIGRLAPGATAESAAAEATALRDRLRAEYPDDYDPGSIAVQPMRDALVGPIRRAVLVLFGAVALVLLIACANVANLFLTRAIGRRPEMALRFALGASRSRIASQVIVEAVTLGLAGGTLGTALAALLLRSAADLAPATLPRADLIGVDGRMLTFAFGVSVVTGVAFGLIPALRASSAGLRAAMGAGSRGAVGGGARTRGALVVIDLALALLLLTGAGLMLRSVDRLLAVDPGFDPDGVVTVQLSLIGRAWAEDDAVRSFQRQLLERAEALPGVASAALAGQVPMGGNFDTWGVRLRDARATDATPLNFQRYSVSPSYRDVMGLTVTRGRFVNDEDVTTSTPVVVLSESAAGAAWPGQDPIGRQIHIGAPDAPWRTVVGVTANVLHNGLGTEPDLQMYLPQSQMTDSYLVLALRSAGPEPATLIPVARDAIRGLDATVPIYEAADYQTLLSRSMGAERFVMRLLTGFAGIALLLAAVGLYGVVAYAVTNRRRELAVRLALGARTSHIIALLFTSGAAAIGAGIAIGLTASYALAGFLGSLLHGVDAFEPGIMLSAVLVLLVVAVSAHALPIRRALSLSPSAALKKE